MGPQSGLRRTIIGTPFTPEEKFPSLAANLAHQFLNCVWATKKLINLFILNKRCKIYRKYPSNPALNMHEPISEVHGITY